MSSLEIAGRLSGASFSENGVPQIVSLQPGEQTVAFTHDLARRSMLRPRRPQLPGRVLRDHERLHPAVVDLRREARIERVRVGRRVVAVAVEVRGGVPDPVLPYRSGRAMRRRASPRPRARRPVVLFRVSPTTPVSVHVCVSSVEAEDVEVTARRVEQLAPPGAVVEPQLRLGLRPARRHAAFAPAKEGPWVPITAPATAGAARDRAPNATVTASIVTARCRR